MEKQRVYMIDLEGNILETFESLTAAAEATGISGNSISRAKQGRLKTAGGFQWATDEDNAAIGRRYLPRALAAIAQNIETTFDPVYFFFL